MKIFKQIKQFDTTEIEDEWIILNTDNYTVTMVNDIGGFCWRLLNEPQTPNSLLLKIKDSYDTPTTINDVEDFLQQLIACGLVEYAS